jgi:hypothetical protein
MGKKNHREQRAPESRNFEDCRTIDVTDRRAMRFWSHRLGVPEEEIVEVVREVGANSTAVALKLEAPPTERTVTPSLPLR